MTLASFVAALESASPEEVVALRRLLVAIPERARVRGLLTDMQGLLEKRAWEYGAFDGSASTFKTYDECGERWARTFVGGEVAAPTDQMETGTLVHKALEDIGRLIVRGEMARDVVLTAKDLRSYLPASTPVRMRAAEGMLKATARMLDFAHIEWVELPWRIETADGVVCGRFDRVDLGTDETASVTVIDYKTGGLVLSKAEAEADPQVLLYLLAASRQWPSAVLRLTLLYVSVEHAVTIRATPELLARAEQYLADRLRAMKHPDVSARPGGWCVQCSFRGSCRAYRSLWGAGPEARVDPAGPIGEVLAERHRLATLAKVAEAERKDFDAALRVRLDTVMQAHGVDSVVGDGLRAKLVTREQKDMPPLDETVDLLASQTKTPKGVVLDKIALVDAERVRDFLASIQDAELRARLAKEVEDRRVAFDAYTYVDVRPSRAPW